MTNPWGYPYAVFLTTVFVLVGAACAPPIERDHQGPPPLPPIVETPEPPPPAPTPESRFEPTTARERHALDLLMRGDLAAALVQWRILLTLNPDNTEVQRQLSATRALIRHRVTERLATGAALERRGDSAVARDTYLRALALDPGNQDALMRLRTLESDAVYAVQQARLDKLRARRATAAARKSAGKTGEPPSREDNGNGQERDYREMGIALFESGDYEASILELRRYLGSFPEDDGALKILRKAEARARERNASAVDPAFGSAPAPIAAGQKSPFAVAAPPAGSQHLHTSPTESPMVTGADEEAAQDLYERGMRVHRQDIAQAIRLWEQSLERNPGHVQARLRLEQAHKMQRRLETIDRQ